MTDDAIRSTDAGHARTNFEAFRRCPDAALDFILIEGGTLELAHNGVTPSHRVDSPVAFLVAAAEFGRIRKAEDDLRDQIYRLQKRVRDLEAGKFTGEVSA